MIKLTKSDMEKLRENCLDGAKAFPVFKSHKDLESQAKTWEIPISKCENTINRVLDFFKDKNKNTKNIIIYAKIVDGLIPSIKKILQTNWIPEEGFDPEDPYFKELSEKFIEVRSCLFSLHTLIKKFYETVKVQEPIKTPFKLQPLKRVKQTTYKFDDWKRECLKDFFKKPDQEEEIKEQKKDFNILDLEGIERNLLSKEEDYGIVFHGILITGWIGKQALELLNSHPFQYEASSWGRTLHHAIGLSRISDGTYWLIKQALLLGTLPSIENHDQATKLFRTQAEKDEDWGKVFKAAHLHIHPIRKKGKNYWIIIPRSNMGQISINQWGLV